MIKLCATEASPNVMADNILTSIRMSRVAPMVEPIG